MELPGLCSICHGCLVRHEGLLQGPDEGDPEPEWLFKAHMNTQSLAASHDASCTICALLWASLTEEQIAFLSTIEISEMLTNLLVMKENDTLIALGKSVEECWLIAASFWDLPNEWPGEQPFVMFILEPVADAALDYSHHINSDSTSSDETWQLALKWIDICRTNPHDSCASGQVDEWYPTRLLDVGQHEDSHIRLIQTSDMSPSSGYVALSHCWGAAEFLKLTKETARQLHDGVKITNLPLTFQHAIIVTRKMQRRYMWIDSLCIYQDEDDKSDWTREASLMNKVYSNCEFNIAATGARDGDSGLFFTRKPETEFQPTKVSWLQQEYVLTDFQFLERELGLAPLNQRGWVLQERLLSPRILHFGKKQLFWECNQGVLCERFPIRLPSTLRNTVMARFSSLRKFHDNPQTPQHGESIEHPDDSSSAYAIWKRIARSYSRAAITFPDDKLVALSGVAKVMREMLDDVYIVGMWKRYLASHLLWYVDKTLQGNGSPSTRAFPYRAPTWSWLSVDGKIDFPTARASGLWITVLDIDVRFSTADTTGPVSSGTLTLCGRLRPLQLRKEVIKPSDLGSELVEKAIAKGVSLDDCIVEVPRQWVMTVGNKDLKPTQGEVWERRGLLVALDVPPSDFDESNRCQELFIMSAGGPFTGPDSYHFHDILILKCIDKDAGRFHRIGLATVDVESQSEIFDMIKEFDDVESSLPCVSYDAQKHLHTIILE
ncbi:HET-domain-containing protein [Nemania sp. FL0916]|nr:HET-domain-containing protein [Nemania sp. FL0916]